MSRFDRLVFRGILRRLSFVEGLRGYLSARHVLLKEFGAHAQAVSERIKAACLAAATAEKLPVQSLASWGARTCCASWGGKCDDESFLICR